MSPKTPPSGQEPINPGITPPPVGRQIKNNQTAGPSGSGRVDEVVIASEVQRVDNSPSAPAKESLASTVTGFLQRRTGNKPDVLNRALAILGIESNDGGPITSA